MNTSTDLMNKGFSLYDPRVDLGRDIVRMSVNSLRWYAMPVYGYAKEKSP